MVDHERFRWTDRHWRGIDLSSSVLYELHVGTFTDAGTFDAAIARLDHLVGLGATAVELLLEHGLNGLGPLDALVAATALAHEIPLYTREAVFQAIAELEVVVPY